VRTSAVVLALASVTAFASGCTSDEWPPLDVVDDEDTGDDGDGDADDGDDDGIYDSAHLEVFEPEGASIHLIGEPMPLLAEVRRADGFPVEFDDIYWFSGIDDPTLHVGPEGEIELAPGVYDIAAVAELPNGDRLETRVNDVRVQSRWTGEYAGDATMQLAVDFQGLPVSPTCRGPFSMRVGFDGLGVEMEGGTCALDVVLAQFDATYTITGQLTATGTGSGTIAYQLAGGIVNITMDWTGAFTEHGFAAGFEGQANILLIGNADVSGSLQADLIDPYVDPE
jgi:hypothetical protein